MANLGICKKCGENICEFRCETCLREICDDCTLYPCDWCDHMRTSCDPCPFCNKILKLCGGNMVCQSWIVTGMYDSEIAYCIVHNNMVPVDKPPKECILVHDKEAVDMKYNILYK